MYDTKGPEGVTEYEKNQDMAEKGMSHGMPRGPNYQVELTVALDELYLGTLKNYNLERNVVCDSCSGTGAKDGNMKKCHRCEGRGAVIENVRVGMGFTMQMQNQCRQCSGTGKMISEKCPHCGGRKVHGEQKKFEVQVEAGMVHGQKIIFEGESEQHPDFLPGDIVFIVKEREHNLFRRNGNDLHTSMTLSLKEALLGFKRSITHLDGHIVTIKSDQPTQPFSVQTLEDEGMPFHNVASQKGLLHVKFIVKMPRSVSVKERELIQKIYG